MKRRRAKQARLTGATAVGLEIDGPRRKLSGITLTLGYSRMMMAEAALDEKLGTVLRTHEEAFRRLGGVPEEILYDRMRTVWMDINERGEIVWNPVFLDFARCWGSHRVCASLTCFRVAARPRGRNGLPASEPPPESAAASIIGRGAHPHERKRHS